MEINEKLLSSIKKLEMWIENNDYKGYEPFDGLSSYLRPLTFNNLLLERILQQIIRQSPINLRPILGIKKQISTKGRGYMAWGYLIMYKITGEKNYKEKALNCLSWLDKKKASGYLYHSWGNHFDFSSRSGRLPKFKPIVVWTSLIGQAYLDAYEMFEDKKHLDIIKSISKWILELPREKTDRGACLSYVATGQSSIHNANMLGAAFLARASNFMNNGEELEVAKEAMIYSCSRQNPDGSWYYGERPNYHWIDNFHTGYNLDSLKCYIDSTNDKTFEKNLIQGFRYFKNKFFEKSGRPKYYHNRVYPVDSQCASQAIDTLAYFSEYDSTALDLAIQVAIWTINNMQDQNGFFYYRQYPLIKAKTPMLHWAQATTYKALALLILEIGKYQKTNKLKINNVE